MSQDSTVFGREPTRPIAEPDPEAGADTTEPDPGADATEPGGQVDLDWDRTPVTDAGNEEAEAVAAGIPGDPEATAPGVGAEPDELSEQFDAAKVGFVDEPRRAVERAAELVAEALRDMERRVDRAADPSTEELRVAFQRYRAIFDLIRAGGAPEVS